MKIAVTYGNGEIFQHFGRTEEFKVYNVEDNMIVGCEVIGSNGSGHGALAGFLAEQGVEVLICGGLGAHALEALAKAGIQVYAGASGDADEAVTAFLRGELEDSGANCDHHDHAHGEDHDCGSDCGGGCAGCGGGCGGGPMYEIDGPNVGKSVKVHYTGTFNDGKKFDSSYDRGEPLEFVCGAGMMIPGFDRAVALMEPGEVVNVHLFPEEAYGLPNPALFLTFEIAQMPGAEGLNVGDQAYLANQNGPFPVRVSAKDDKMITFDANHEMAGKELNFRIELMDVAE